MPPERPIICLGAPRGSTKCAHADASPRTWRSFTPNASRIGMRHFCLGSSFSFWFSTNTSSENADTGLALLGTCRKFSPTGINAANAPVTFMAMQKSSCACWCALPCWRAASHAAVKSESRGRTSGPDSKTPVRFESDETTYLFQIWMKLYQGFRKPLETLQKTAKACGVTIDPLGLETSRHRNVTTSRLSSGVSVPFRHVPFKAVRIGFAEPCHWVWIVRCLE